MVLRYAIAGAIVTYQRHISPHKGFCCAHRALHGGWSCSEFGHRVILRYGVLRFFRLQFRRFRRCTHAFSALQSQPPSDEKIYTDFPWKSCLKSKEAQSLASGCCCFPWGS
ncbi:MAG: membrane protein insertion efficiency factor YidD [Pseudomonadota bacterium]|nr:membrane protein insertion efficiency factor YidD [Pseudomonadota bacterium]